jgi:hypothetical protein
LLQKEKEDVLRALSALVEQGSNTDGLMALLAPFEAAGKYEIVYEMATRLHPPGAAQIVLWTQAYHDLKQLQGQSVALAWLQNKIPPKMLNFASMVFYDESRFELLWTLVKDPAPGEEGADMVWLLRAASVVRSGRENNPHWKDVVEHYKNSEETYYDFTGRYLVGLATEEELMALATDPKKVCELSYYIGLKAQAEGRYEDASDWFRASVETGLRNNGEYRWSFATLDRWLRSGKNLKRLSEEEQKKTWEPS